MGTGTKNSLMRYKKSLKEKHKELDSSIKEAYNKHIKDEVLTEMKKLKLSLKEKLRKLEIELQGR